MSESLSDLVVLQNDPEPPYKKNQHSLRDNTNGCSPDSADPSYALPCAFGTKLLNAVIIGAEPDTASQANHQSNSSVSGLPICRRAAIVPIPSRVEGWLGLGTLRASLQLMKPNVTTPRPPPSASQQYIWVERCPAAC